MARYIPYLLVTLLLCPSTALAGLWRPMAFAPLRVLGSGPVVVLDPDASGLNATQMETVRQSVENDYASMAGSITVTTGAPPSGYPTVHTITLWGSANSYTFISTNASGTPEVWVGGAYGYAPAGSSASVYVGEFSRRPEFTQLDSLLNAVADTVSHELDHILRGGGHSSGNPEDLGCSGACVPNTVRATMTNRAFNSTDMGSKISHVADGTTGLDEAVPLGTTHFIRGALPEDAIYDLGTGEWDQTVEDYHATFDIHIFVPVPGVALGTVTDSGDFVPYVYADTIWGNSSFEGGTRVNWAAQTPDGQVWPVSEHGEIWLPDPLDPDYCEISPEFSVMPVVTEPYYCFAHILVNTPAGQVEASLETDPPTGFTIEPTPEPPGPIIPMLPTGSWGRAILAFLVLGTAALLLARGRRETVR